MIEMNYLNEIDKNCLQVLRAHFPNDMIDGRSIEDVQSQEIKGYNQCHFFAGIGGFPLAFELAGLPASANVYTGGFPCQDLSVAGKRQGLAGSRSGLYFQFHRLVTENLPEWVVIENVPGLLSSNAGKTLQSLLEGLPESYLKFLQTAGGTPGFSAALSTRWHTGFSMRNFSEFPNAGGACSLSQVLETDVAPKYYLSQKAAKGILTRAEKRGKSLPSTLDKVLRQVASDTEANPPR